MEGLALVLCLLSISSCLAAITFDGLTPSFAQFHRWQPSTSSRGVVGSLSLHFKTHIKDSLILYQDDGGQDYLSIELYDGTILATFVSEGKSVRVEIGQDLGDMNWHNIKIQIKFDRAILTLDKRITKTATGLSNNNNALVSSSDYLYVGGLPSSLSLSSLSWPGAVFKKGFVGCIKKLMLTNEKNLSEKAVLVKSKGTKSGCLNECRARNPCLNKGKCIVRFPKAQCDCSGTGFEGARCEKEIVQLHLTKKDYLIYDMSSNPKATQTDNISIRFKTSKRNGVLLRTSFAQDYLIIKLWKGSLKVEWNLGSGRLEMTVGNGKLHDNQWHLVDITRMKRRVTLNLDGTEVQDMTPRRHSTFNMHGGEGKVYIGGMRDGSSKGQFVGCLKKMVFNNLEMIRKLKVKDSRLTLEGKALWSCPEAPVTTRTTTLTSTVKRYKTNIDEIPSVRELKSYTNLKTTASFPLKTEKRKCSPNDVRCVLYTFPPSSPKSTSKPPPSKPTLCKLFNNCSIDVVTTNRKKLIPTNPTTNTTATTANQPDIQGLEGAENELGNVPTAIGLVVGSIVLFVFCAIVSVKLKQRRDRKSHAHHEVTIEHREVDEMINTHVFHPEDHDIKS